MIRIRNISKSFGQRKVLDDISFNRTQGKIVGVLGPNGAGKTTTIKCLVGLCNKDSGKIEVKGEILDNFQNLKFKVKIGVSMEIPFLFSHLTAKENLEVFSL